MDAVSARAQSSRPIVGRSEELARLDTVLAGGGVAAFHGPPGCGLSTLVAEGARRATARGMTVLRTSGAEGEQDFPYAGLHQLLRPLEDALAGPLLAVFGVSAEPVPTGAEVSAATLELLEAVRPVLVAADDAQWLDAATTEVLEAMAADAAGRGLSVVTATHGAGAGPAVAPLGDDDATLLVDALQPDLDPFVRGRVLKAAQGSPLALVELPGALRGASDGAVLSPWLPLSDRLSRAFGPGVDELPPPTGRLLLAAALADDGRLADAIAASGAQVEDLAPAREADLVACDGERLRFPHPLTRAAVVAAASVAERDAAHRALATVVADADARTRHRAACAIGDAELADELAAVADRARSAGRFDEAAALSRRAALLTGDPPTRSRRLVEAAERVRELGAVAIAERLLAEVDPDVVAMLAAAGSESDRPVEQLVLLGHAAVTTGDPARGVVLLERAAERLLAERRIERRIRVLPMLAWGQLAIGRWDDAERTAAEAVALAPRVRQPLWGAAAAAALGLLAGVRGDEDEAEAHLAGAEREALPAAALSITRLVQHARAITALSAGRAGEAYGQLALLHTGASRHASASWSLPDLAEAAVTDEQRAAARRALDDAVRLAGAAPAPQLHAALAHARLVLGDGDDAVDARAWPFTHARMNLARGERLRRQRRMAESREPLRDAAAVFERLGARPWADRAHRELAATMETSHRGDEAERRLTPQELEIARLVSQGLTNREVAATLHLSPRTVSSHLARVFRKLDVASRAEVGAALGRA